MLSDKDKQLIHRAIDGELSESEKAAFHRLIETSPEARRFYEQIDSLSALAAHAGTEESPADLKPAVLRAIAQRQRIPVGQSSSPRTIGAWFGTILTPRLAYGLAAGLIIGVAVSTLTIKGPTGHLDPLDLSGTIVGGAGSKSLQRIDADNFSESQAKGRIAVDAAENLRYIQLEIASTQEVSAVLDYDPAAYVLRAFEQASPRSGNITTSEGRLSATQVGQNRYVIVLERIAEAEARTVCRVEAGGVIYQRELAL